VRGTYRVIHERCFSFSFFGFGYRWFFFVCFALLRSDLRLVLLLRAFMRGIFLAFFGDFPAIFYGCFFLEGCLFLLECSRERGGEGGGTLAAGGSGGDNGRERAVYNAGSDVDGSYYIVPNDHAEQAAIRRLASEEPGPGQKYAVQARKWIADLRRSRQNIRIEIRWCPAHEGVPSNEKADGWAKLAADEPDACGVEWLRRAD
jgi:hypothetical protein